MPPDQEPRRERVLAAVAARLGTIQAGAAYWATPALVTRALLGADAYRAELEIGPVYGVMRSIGSRLEPDAQGTYEDTFRFTVEAYVRERSGVLAGTWLERAWADQLACLLGERTLGGLVLTLRPESTDTDEGGLEPVAWVSQTWAAVMPATYD